MQQRLFVFLTTLLINAAIFTCDVMAQRQVIDLKRWQFSRDKAEWKEVNIPHDWAIDGPFDKKWDLQTVRIEQNGEKKATEKSGRSGALPWIGKGYYKCTVNSAQFTNKDGVFTLQFDGAMAEPTVFVNGQKAGYWAYGYNAFRLDITPLIKDGDNTIEVELENKEESSRWYPGAGLYRPVSLVITPKAHIDPWATSIRTVGLKQGVDNHGRDENQAAIDYETKLCVSPADAADLACVIEILNDKGFMEAGSHFDVPEDGIIKTELTLSKPNLWTPETPYLYKVRTRLMRNHKVIDETITNLGVRTVTVSREGGFQLNGVTRKIKGVCLHHDLGPLGAAVNKAALIRQIKLMKDMGCDAIRTSHNMPSTMQMDLCDSLGMMVMAESFDMWQWPKCKNGYSRFYKDWWRRDLQNLVLAHRLHPSIVMWSIGNEISEQGAKEGNRMTREMQDLVHSLDKTRPVTSGMDRIDNAISSGFAQVLDIPGINYRTQRYHAAYEKLRHGFILGSETASTISSRGVYKFPVQHTENKAYDDGQCSSYDMEACWWSNIPEEDWLLQDEFPWVIGEFVWTGFDYLGEPTPYDEYWPSRSSYFGIFDLAGLPKDRYYLYRSRWNKDEKTIHLLPHWTFPGREGEVTPVYCYTNYPTAELFVNGKSQGKISKKTEVKKGSGKEDKISDVNDPAIDRYRLRWNNVKYEPGEIKVVVYDENGKEVGAETVRTAGAASRIQLTGDLGADIKPLKADGEDMTFITVNILDKAGNLVPDACNPINVSVTGTAHFKGICNGDATSTEVFTKPTMKAFHGQLVIGIQNNGKRGAATVNVTSKGLKPATIIVNSQ